MRSATDSDPSVGGHRHAHRDYAPVSEEDSFLEHRAALEATVLAPSGRDEWVFELDSGVLRRPL